MAKGPFDFDGDSESPAMKKVREQIDKDAKEAELQRARYESAVAHRLKQDAKRELESSSESPPLKPGFMEHIYEAAYRLSGGIGLIMIAFSILMVFTAKSEAASGYIYSSFVNGAYMLMISALFKIVATLTSIHRLLLGQCR